MVGKRDSRAYNRLVCFSMFWVGLEEEAFKRIAINRKRGMEERIWVSKGWSLDLLVLLATEQRGIIRNQESTQQAFLS